VFGVASQTRGGIATILQNDLEATLAAIAEVGTLNVLSRPSILARNNQQATITIGQEVPFIRNSRITESGQTINTVEYEDIGIILTVTPRIGADGLIELDVAPEISTLTGDTVAISDTVNAPVFAKRSAQTQVIVPSGRTVVIGGLMEDHETSSVRKVPLLGSIPWLGVLFRRTVTSKTKTELLIFLTPTLVDSSVTLAAVSAVEQSGSQMLREQTTPEQLRRYLGEPAAATEPVP
jgi:general secretion pathway protein D